MKKYNWLPIEEMDLDDGTHTGYAADDGGDYRIYLTQIHDNTWDVELQRKGESYFTTLVNCKTLTSAKRWAARYL